MTCWTLECFVHVPVVPVVCHPAPFLFCSFRSSPGNHALFVFKSKKSVRCVCILSSITSFTAQQSTAQHATNPNRLGLFALLLGGIPYQLFIIQFPFAIHSRGTKAHQGQDTPCTFVESEVWLSDQAPRRESESGIARAQDDKFASRTGDWWWTECREALPSHTFTTDDCCGSSRPDFPPHKQ